MNQAQAADGTEPTRAQGPDPDGAIAPPEPDVAAGGGATEIEPAGYLLGSAEHPVILIERLLRATPGDVWSAWTEPDRVARWLGAIEAPLSTPGVQVRIAMAESELPADFDQVENPATFTVREAVAPAEGRDGRLVLTFDDRADPSGRLIVSMRAADGGCLLTLRHALAPVAGAIDQSAGFGAGWEGFLDWLEEALTTGSRGDVDRYEALEPLYQRRQSRLALVRDGSVSSSGGGAVVRHERSVEAPVERVWDLVATSDGLATWLGRVAEGELGPGASVVLVQDDIRPEERQRWDVTAYEPLRRLVVEWTGNDEPPSTFSIELTSDGDRTRLELEERGIRPENADGYLAGWHAHLDVLVAAAEGFGIPSLRQALLATGT